MFLQEMLGLNDPNNPNGQEDLHRKSSSELLRSMNITIGVCRIGVLSLNCNTFLRDSNKKTFICLDFNIQILGAS